MDLCKSPNEANLLSTHVENVAGEIQGPEWTIVKQLAKRTSGIEQGGGQKASLMALMVSRGLVSEDYLLGYHSAVAAYGGVTPVLPETTSLGKKDGDTIEGKQSIELDVMNCDVSLGLIPAIIDGPYLCTSLNHRAPVIDVTWRDDGPMTDSVFVPSVLCSLTIDNCLTIWLESSAEVSFVIAP